MDDASAVFDASILTGPVANYPIADTFNRGNERDCSTGDMPHVFVSSVVWDLPAGGGRRRQPQGWIGAVINDWTVTALVTLQSGVPVAVTHMNPKSFVARVTKNGAACKVTGVILNDGTPIKSVEVKVDDGPWQPATLDPVTSKEKYGWKLFTYTWNNPSPGDHTLVSRVTQTDGKVQPTEQDLAEKKSFLEQNSQAPRKVKIA